MGKHARYFTCDDSLKKVMTLLLMQTCPSASMQIHVVPFQIIRNSPSHSSFFLFMYVMMSCFGLYIIILFSSFVSPTRSVHGLATVLYVQNRGSRKRRRYGGSSSYSSREMRRSYWTQQWRWVNQQLRCRGFDATGTRVALEPYWYIFYARYSSLGNSGSTIMYTVLSVTESLFWTEDFR